MNKTDQALETAIARGCLALSPNNELVRKMDGVWELCPLYTDKWGYFILSIPASVGGVASAVKAHRAVFRLFYGYLPDSLQIDHIDRNRKNNAPENLRLVTPLQQAQNRTAQDQRGEKGTRVVLTQARVDEIRRMRDQEKLGASTIANQLGLNLSTVKNIYYGYQWTHA